MVEVAVVDAQERRGVLERRRTERETRSSVGRSVASVTKMVPAAEMMKERECPAGM